MIKTMTSMMRMMRQHIYDHLHNGFDVAAGCRNSMRLVVIAVGALTSMRKLMIKVCLKNVKN